MKTVVAATDLSERSTVALDRAEAVARATGARLLIVHAVDDDLPRPVVERARKEAEDLLSAEASRRGVDAAWRVVVGDVFWALRSVALDARADLLVAGDHRRSALRDAFRDTTVERLIRVSPCSVLVSRVPAAGSHRHALLGIESDEAPELLAAISALADCRPQRITAIHAFDAAGSGPLLYAGASRDEVMRYEQEKAAILRKDLASRIGAFLDQPIEVRIADGAPFQVIETAVRQYGCDIVVVSTHARRALTRALLGSVSSSLIRHGTSDVLVVPRANSPEMDHALWSTWNGGAD